MVPLLLRCLNDLALDNQMKNLNCILPKPIVSILIVSAMIIGTTANAGWIRSSKVTDVVTYNNDGTWTYDFTVHNTSKYDDISGDGPEDDTFWEQPLIVDWELPFFYDMSISNIQSPDGWTFAIETIGQVNTTTGWEGVAAWQNPSDLWYAGANSPYTTGNLALHWYCVGGVNAGTDAARVSCEDPATGLSDEPIFPEDPFSSQGGGNSLSGFSFTAGFGPTNAPYQASWLTLPILTGDPAFPSAGVGSPSVVGQSTVPEPGMLSLLSLGLLGLYGTRRRNRHKVRH